MPINKNMDLICYGDVVLCGSIGGMMLAAPLYEFIAGTTLGVAIIKWIAD